MVRRWRYTGGTWRAAEVRTAVYLAKSLVMYITLSALNIESRHDISEEKHRQSELYIVLADNAANHAASVSQTSS